MPDGQAAAGAAPEAAAAAAPKAAALTATAAAAAEAPCGMESEDAEGGREGVIARLAAFMGQKRSLFRPVSDGPP